ncbi:uncharacterized protein Tco025E_04918 [Trypanosoma conorhini]|uniref:Uncharacterized protein n=1 Tax=Trypanosoma conorhini TaxID=83891 RepID=A0A422PHI5_9TRYP|nr:uncharacterized protein Tco025E_04918 [Trypanosoma conorhini]RNF17179.1 hypothetical protein Tco025E_04918 [Trypanosoma conorhini]
MTALDFGVVMQDQRLTPLMQVMARLALDGEFSPFHCDALRMSLLYRAALAPFCCVGDEGDLAAVCAAVLRDVIAGAEVVPGGSVAGGQLTPAFITRSSDKGGLLAERRFLLRLKEQRRMARILLSQTTSH